MASFLVDRTRHLIPIFLFRGRVLAQTLIATANKRYFSQEKPISRFPVPVMDTLPKDIQERMKEVQEKVKNKQKVMSGDLLRGCEAIRVRNWDEFVCFFFFFMVVANSNASCYWLQW